MIRMMTPPYDIQERTFQFSVQIVYFFRQLSTAHESTKIMAKQLLRSATSVGANMEEADGGQTKPDFRTKVATAKKEAKETVYWLRLIAATDEPLRMKVLPLLDEAKQIAAIVSAIKRNAELSDIAAGRPERGIQFPSATLSAFVIWHSALTKPARRTP